jgi:arylformamidase
LSKVFLDYTQQELDAQYNQRAWVPDVERIVAGMAAASDAVRTRIGSPEEISYGASPLESLDIYGGRKAKAFVFVHGGAWQRESRRGSAFGAGPVVAAGASFVVLGFASIPRVTLPEMAAQVVRGLEWIQRNLSGEIFLFGHSSGAHLSAVALTKTACVKRAMVVSGLYDLHPVRLSARQAYVKLDDSTEDDLSPIRHANRIRCPVTVACAEKDSDEFRRQAREFSNAVKTDLLQVKHVNHFEIVETLADPASPICRAALKMLE